MLSGVIRKYFEFVITSNDGGYMYIGVTQTTPNVNVVDYPGHPAVYVVWKKWISVSKFHEGTKMG